MRCVPLVFVGRWYSSAVLTFSIWGTLGLIIGLAFLGLGVPMAIIGAAWSALNKVDLACAVFLTLLLNLVLTFGLRIFGIWLATRTGTKSSAFADLPASETR
jgi:thiol:disulfide interchange protein